MDNAPVTSVSHALGRSDSLSMLMTVHELMP